MFRRDQTGNWVLRKKTRKKSFVALIFLFIPDEWCVVHPLINYEENYLARFIFQNVVKHWKGGQFEISRWFSIQLLRSLCRKPCSNYVKSNLPMNVKESSVDENTYFCKKDVTRVLSVQLRCKLWQSLEYNPSPRTSLNSLCWYKKYRLNFYRTLTYLVCGKLNIYDCLTFVILW